MATAQTPGRVPIVSVAAASQFKSGMAISRLALPNPVLLKT